MYANAIPCQHPERCGVQYHIANSEAARNCAEGFQRGLVDPHYTEPRQPTFTRPHVPNWSELRGYMGPIDLSYELGWDYNNCEVLMSTYGRNGDNSVVVTDRTQGLPIEIVSRDIPHRSTPPGCFWAPTDSPVVQAMVRNGMVAKTQETAYSGTMFEACTLYQRMR